MVLRLRAKPPCGLLVSDRRKIAETVLAGYLQEGLNLVSERKESSETLAESWPRIPDDDGPLLGIRLLHYIQ